jgi:hypothetical protein
MTSSTNPTKSEGMRGVGGFRMGGCWFVMFTVVGEDNASASTTSYTVQPQRVQKREVGGCGSRVRM